MWRRDGTVVCEFRSVSGNGKKNKKVLMGLRQGRELGKIQSLKMDSSKGHGGNRTGELLNFAIVFAIVIE
jgi:hypothetical protein